MKKYCYQCKRDLELKEFYKNSLSKDGLFKTCKSCCMTRQRARDTKRIHSKSVKLYTLKNEIFKKHPNGLYISNKNRVWMPEDYHENRISASRYLKFTVMANGYYAVNVGASKKIYVHRMVAEVFLDNPFKLKAVNHKDLNKLNNEPENLEWCSLIENLKHAQENDRFATKLNREQVLKIRKDKRPVKIIARDYGVSDTNIRLIMKRKIWKHI